MLRPGFLSPSAGLKFADIPNGLAAVSKVPVAGWAQIAAYFGFVEFSGGFDDYKSGTPGDYGFKVLTSSDPAEKTKKLSAELANGRLAMMAIIGMFLEGISLSAKLLRASVRRVSYGYWKDWKDWKGWFDQMGSCSIMQLCAPKCYDDSFDALQQAAVSKLLCI